MQQANNSPLISVIMGSQSDWQTMLNTVKTLDKLNISYEVKIISAHRTPDRLFYYAEKARNRGIRVIIAGAGGAAHLPGMVAAKTSLPVIGVPVKSSTLNGIDSLLSIVQMPSGIPVATVAIGESGAINAAILAASIISTYDKQVCKSLENYREEQTLKVTEEPLTETSL